MFAIRSGRETGSGSNPSRVHPTAAHSIRPFFSHICCHSLIHRSHDNAQTEMEPPRCRYLSRQQQDPKKADEITTLSRHFHLAEEIVQIYRTADSNESRAEEFD